MKKIIGKVYPILAKMTAAMMFLVLFVNANSASCHMIYQPKAPEGLNKFKMIDD